MASRFDIQLENNDLVIKNGDFVFAPSDEQHIQDTINAFPSWWKENPQDGVGIRSWIGSPANAQEANRKIRIQLESDGYNVQNPSVKFDADGKLIVQPNATI